MGAAFRQLSYLAADANRIVNGKWWRLFGLLFATGFHTVALYRFDRFLYLALGRLWGLLRLMLSPVFFLLRPWIHGAEIHYKADIGPGILILHPSLGVVVSSYSVIGRNVTFTGGNCIGVRDGKRTGLDIEIGDNVILGINSVIIGPLRVGSRVIIGASSAVLHDIPDGVNVGGVPARPLGSGKGSPAAAVTA